MELNIFTNCTQNHSKNSKLIEKMFESFCETFSTTFISKINVFVDPHPIEFLKFSSIP